MKKTALFLALLLSLSLFAADDEDEELLAAVDNLGPAAEGYISEGDFGPENQTFNDNRVLRDFIESRGLIECRKKCGQLTIAGDARARWLASGEKVHGDKARGMGTTTAINRFKNEFNLFLDYTTGCSWVSTKLRWDSFAGNDGGSATKVELDRAFIGYDVHQEGDRDFYIELGRSNLGLMFESRVEFGSPFSGIHLYYTDSWENVGTLTVHGGPFVMDSYLNHYAWVAEAGITELGGSGLAVKYTLIDWQRSAPTLNYGNLPASGSVQIRDNPRYRFLVSQMLCAYEKKIDFLHCKMLYAYGAVLANHDARKSFSSGDKYLNHAWYVGFTLGKLCKACDWSIDINYQSVQAQAVPEFDLSGIGHGNAAGTLFSDAVIQGLNPYASAGFSNYKGWEISALYAMTDTLSMRTKAVWTRPRNRSVGGDFFFKAFEMSAIYAF